MRVFRIVCLGEVFVAMALMTKRDIRKCDILVEVCFRGARPAVIFSSTLLAWLVTHAPRGHASLESPRSALSEGSVGAGSDLNVDTIEHSTRSKITSYRRSKIIICLFSSLKNRGNSAKVEAPRMERCHNMHVVIVTLLLPGGGGGRCGACNVSGYNKYRCTKKNAAPFSP